MDRFLLKRSGLQGKSLSIGGGGGRLFNAEQSALGRMLPRCISGPRLSIHQEQNIERIHKYIPGNYSSG